MIKDAAETIKLFVQNNYDIDRHDNSEAWLKYKENDMTDDFRILKDVFGFDVIERNGQAHFAAVGDDSIFRKPAKEQKADFGVPNNDTLYLMYLIELHFFLLFYSGEKKDLKLRDFILVDAFIDSLNQLCKEIESTGDAGEQKAHAFGLNIVRCARQWNAKPEGSPDDNAGLYSRYAIVRKVIVQLEKNRLVVKDNTNKITPTARLSALIEYSLKQERGEEIACLLKGASVYA